MQSREACIPFLGGITHAETEVKGGAVCLGCGEGRVIALPEVQTTAVEGLCQQSHACTQREPPAKHFLVVGVLCKEILVFEQTNAVIHESSTYAVVGAEHP